MAKNCNINLYRKPSVYLNFKFIVFKKKYYTKLIYFTKFKVNLCSIFLEIISSTKKTFLSQYFAVVLKHISIIFYPEMERKINNFNKFAFFDCHVEWKSSIVPNCLAAILAMELQSKQTQLISNLVRYIGICYEFETLNKLICK